LTPQVFSDVAQKVLAEHTGTPLAARWEEATSFGSGSEAAAFWIRATDDVVNIVWACPEGLKDITFFPLLGHSTFNFVPYRSIASIETRVAENIARILGYDVTGDFIVRILTNPFDARLVWIAESADAVEDLRSFLRAVLNLYITNSG